MSRGIHATLAAALALAAVASDARAQAMLVVDNEPVEARLAGRKGEVHTFVVDVKEDGQVVKFRVASRTTELALVQITNGKTKFPFHYTNGNKVNSSGGMQGLDMERQTPPLPIGRYLISIKARENMGTGPYTFTVLEPPLKGDRRKVGGGGDEVSRLREEVQELRRRLEKLEKMLEKR